MSPSRWHGCNEGKRGDGDLRASWQISHLVRGRRGRVNGTRLTAEQADGTLLIGGGGVTDPDEAVTRCNL